MADFLDDFYLYEVRDAVADDFELYAFNCIAAESIPDDFLFLPNHLDPDYYRTYVLERLIKVDYLVKVQPIPNTLTKCFIGYRDWLKKQGNEGDAVKQQLYKDLSNYLFHYNPADCNYSADILANQHPHHSAKTTWGEKSVFYTYLIEEVNKYLSGLDYDPYAVSFAIRIRIEKIAYDSIVDPAVKSDFLSKNDSFAKIKVCTDNGIKVPLFYMMVLAIGNESAHLMMINGDYEEKDMVFKLRNLSVRRIIEQIFEKTDNPVLLESIYL